MNTVINNNSDVDLSFGKKLTTNEQIKIKTIISYDGHEYFIPGCVALKIGFICGMTEAGLFDSLALPLPAVPSVAQIGHQVLQFMATNLGLCSTGIDYLQKVVLGATSKEYIEQIDKLGVSEIRSVLEQVFALLALADYWDCPEITSGCSEFIALILSKSDQHTVRVWFSGIV